MVTTTRDSYGTSHFFDSPGGRRLAPNDVLVFVPAAVSVPEAVPLLLYFHGHASAAPNLARYLSASGHREWRDFRPLIAGCRVVLVYPWGRESSDFSRFVNDKGAALEALVRGALGVAMAYDAHAKHRPVPAWPMLPPRIILAAHSGGGTPLLRAALSQWSLASRVTQIWALDCLYGDVVEDWRKANEIYPQRRLFLASSSSTQSSRDIGTRAQEIAAGCPNVGVEVTSREHHEFPSFFIPRLLAGSRPPPFHPKSPAAAKRSLQA